MELITVPTFTFNQGDIFKNDANVERPINVLFYNGTIELQQDGEYDVPERILINEDYFKALFKAITKHYPEAKAFLNLKNANTRA